MFFDKNEADPLKRYFMSRGIRKERISITFYKIDFICEEPSFRLSSKRHLSDLPQKLHREIPLKPVSESFWYFPRFTKEREQILDCMAELKTSFDSLEDRQVIYVRLKHLLMQLRKKVDLTTKEFLRTINMCTDAINNIKSEQLNRKQVETLEFVLQEMREDTSEWQAREFQEILFSAGLKPTAGLEGIAELYDNL